MRALSLLTPLALIFVVTATVPSRASPGYPADMKDYLTLKDFPACVLCHSTAAGGVGTATKPFGAALKTRGLKLEDIASLHSSIDKLDADKVDSDGDGVTDIDELHAGTDPNIPNTPGGGGNVPATVAYGFCAAGPHAMTASGVDGALLLLVGAGFAALRRRHSALPQRR